MTYPTSPEFAAINVTSRAANVSSETRSGRRQVRSIGSQRWSFTAQYNTMTRAEFKPIYAFIVAKDGQSGTFAIVPPVISSTNGTASGTALTNGSHTAGDSSIAVNGFTGTLKAGDFIKFASHNKVYMVKEDRLSNGILNIFPALVESVGDNIEVVYNNVPFTMRLDNDLQEFSVNGFDLYQFEVDMVEAL